MQCTSINHMKACGINDLCIYTVFTYSFSHCTQSNIWTHIEMRLLVKDKQIL